MVESKTGSDYYEFEQAVLTHSCSFTSGSKDQFDSPEGLFDAARNETEDNVIFVGSDFVWLYMAH